MCKLAGEMLTVRRLWTREKVKSEPLKLSVPSYNQFTINCKFLTILTHKIGGKTAAINKTKILKED